MKSVVELWTACLLEAGALHHVRIHRDLAYAKSRIEDEGDAFLGISLPAFEKDLLQALSTGGIRSDHFHGFRRSGGLPAFLSGFLREIFDRSGLVRIDASPDVLRTLRQILLLVSKVDASTSVKRQKKAILAYVDTDRQLTSINEVDLSTFARFSRELLAPYLSRVERRLFEGDWVPRHSSGALATRESYNGRYENRVWTERLQEVFPWWEDLSVSPRELLDHLDDFSVLARDDEPPVKVIMVPKTMKSPRIIAMEPAHMQFVQQGIFHVMTEELHSGKFPGLARSFSWMDQDPNRVLSRLGSISGAYATLDLSEASDRVSLQLVEALLSSAPFLRKAVLAARSETALLPSGDVVRLNKFASMGSALCFPIESMVFFIICSMAIAETAGVGPECYRERGLPRLRVFGDDLIVPTIAAQNLTNRLEAFGLKVNLGKSFTTGHFRESCGADWFHGVDVSVYKLRDPLPSSGSQFDLLEGAISFHNRAYHAGWFGVASFVENTLLGVFPRLPYAPPESRAAALWSWDRDPVVRSHPGLQYRQVRSVVFKRIKPADELNGYGALKKFFSPHPEPRDLDHLKRDGRSRCVGASIGWAAHH